MNLNVEKIQQIIAGEKALSTSALKEAKKSTRDFLHYYSKPYSRKDYFDFGDACELYLIDKAAFKEQVYIMDETQRPEPSKDYRTKVNAEWKAAILEDNAEKLIIPATGKDSFETITEIEAMVLRHPASGVLFYPDNKYQDAFEWVCPLTGFKRYSRTDLYSPSRRTIVEIKTYEEDDFARTCATRDYFLAAMDQIKGAVLSGKMDEVENYVFLAIGKKGPLFVDFFEFDFSTALRVEEAYDSALINLKKDLEENQLEDIVWRQSAFGKLTVPNWYK